MMCTSILHGPDAPSVTLYTLQTDELVRVDDECCLTCWVVN